MTTTRPVQILLIVALAATCGLALAAGEPVDRTIPADKDAVIDIEIFTGTLTIIGWDRAEVTIKGTLSVEAEELEVDADGDEISIETEILGDGEGVNLEIHVPRRAELQIETLSASVDIRDVRGIVEVESVSGSIHVEGSPEEAELGTLSGTVTLTAGATGRVDAETMSGAIVIDADPGGEGHLSAESVSGAITIRLPADVSASFQVESFSGDIINEFGPKAKKTDPYIPAKSLSFTVGKGGARIMAETLSGTIEIRKR